MAKKLPKKVKIGGHKYRLSYMNTDALHYEEGDMGMSRKGMLDVEIRPKMDPTIERETVLHELLHCISFVWDIPFPDTDIEEAVVNRMANGLYQVLSDNPELIKYLMEKE